MEAKEKEEFNALKLAHKALQGEHKNLLAAALKKDGTIATLQGKITKGAEDLKTAHELVKSTKAEKAAMGQDLQKVTSERDSALKTITELSTQVADQSTVQTDKDILVKVDGKKYLLERRSLHTLNGEVTAEQAAKDPEFLTMLIQTGAGNIRPVEN